MHNRTRAWISALVIGLLSSLGGVARADDLGSALLKESGAILKKLEKQGQRNVGILKFRIQKGDAPKSSSVGPLNLTLAHRLELALVLASDASAPITLLRDASAAAATLSGANHLTPEGRKALFEGKYRPAWGSGDTSADAFLSGTAALSADLKELKVVIASFDREDRINEVARFTVNVDADILAEAGESFLLRGAFDGGKTTVTAAADAARKERTSHPLMNGDAPVVFQVLYNDKPQPVYYRDGGMWVPEPKESDVVSFQIQTTGVKGRIGVVLKVNGENTLFRETRPDLSCSKWVLPAKDYNTVIKGYQVDGKKAEAFRVLSVPESEAGLMKYGVDGGTIRLTVYREGVPTLATQSEEKQLAVISRVDPPTKPPVNVSALKAQLLYARVQPETRGMLGTGESFEKDVRAVTFHPEPTPLMSATIRYYKVK